jgi:hypothetical protein
VKSPMWLKNLTLRNETNGRPRAGRTTNRTDRVFSVGADERPRPAEARQA